MLIYSTKIYILFTVLSLGLAVVNKSDTSFPFWNLYLAGITLARIFVVSIVCCGFQVHGIFVCL